MKKRKIYDKQYGLIFVQIGFVIKIIEINSKNNRITFEIIDLFLKRIGLLIKKDNIFKMIIFISETIDLFKKLVLQINRYCNIHFFLWESIPFKIKQLFPKTNRLFLKSF